MEQGDPAGSRLARGFKVREMSSDTVERNCEEEIAFLVFSS
jgi:hypothetical protein